ncbi:hypothetical protein [Amycolatopsis sp. PS_44_ISF1]|uniref:hypothetical protein n=1 Tax=Amycolatopsis sp. PS_44_ISF1 TaxID=2974917 RepID=UPI0028DDD397|nr:hypothetical protein [Amycolatopsis sp. PS_44_ISF1]MDT8911015.1 hypothetical protein [Amycolatopsis sp. PS_44_ISF1]
MAQDSGWRTLPDGRRVKLRRKGGVVAAATAVVIGGTALTGTGLGAGAGAGSEALAGNTAGDVVDSLPGRSLKTRKAEARKSAERGKTDEALSRFKLKRLEKRAERETDCLTASSGKVREFLTHTPCTTLNRMLLAVGDGRGDAAVISVVRVGFRTAKQATAFEKVERIQGSGDVRPLEIAAVLGLTGVHLTGRHYHSRPDRTGMIVAETDPATGHLDDSTLDALAEVAVRFPIR